MTRVAIIGASVLAIVGLVSFVAASERGVPTAAETVPADEILVLVDEMGLHPSTRVYQHGTHYVLKAVDPRGREVRVVADVSSGTILSVMPLRESALYPAYSGGPRIIQVPQVDKGNENTVTRARRDVGARRSNHDAQAAPRRMTRAPPPPPARPRTMLNPPGEDDSALTPIYPTPRFETGTEEAREKFGPHADGSPATAD